MPGIEVELNKCYLEVVVKEEQKEKEKRERKLEMWLEWRES